MATYVVSRHEGVPEWLRRQGLHEFTHVAHLNMDQLRRGDLVIGPLPLHVVTALCNRGVKYHHIALDVAEEDRGRDLSADEMERAGARLERVRLIGKWRERMRPPAQIRRVPRRVREAIGAGGRKLQGLAMTNPRIVGWLLLFAILLSGAMMVNRFEDWLAASGVAPNLFGTPDDETLRPQTNVWGFAFWAAVFFVTSSGLYAMRNSLFDLSIRHCVGSAARPRRLVIMNLSPLPHDLQPAVEAAMTKTLDEICAPDALENVIGKRNFPWQQNARIARHHLTRSPRGEDEELRREFVVVLTKEAAPHYEAFRRMLSAILVNSFGEGVLDRVSIEPSEVIQDSFAFDQYRKAYRKIIARKHGRIFDPVPHKEISIDVTAGVKLASVAAAEVTFNSEVEFTYIETLGGGIEPHVFDARIELPPEE